jgi:hypothetical protein
LLGLREKEIDTLKTELRRLQKSNEDMRKHCEMVEKDLKCANGGDRANSQLGFNKMQGTPGLDGVSFNPHFES